MTIGEKIKQVRLRENLTQKQLAEKCGMADSAIRKYESGKITPKFGTVKKIADALNIRPLDLYPDKFFQADYEPVNEEEKSFRNDAVQGLVDEVAVDLGSLSKALKDTRLEAEKKLKDYCEEKFQNLNEAGIQASILAAISIMGDDLMPDEVIASIARGDWSKCSEIINAIEAISNMPVYQTTTDNAAKKSPSDK